MRLLEATIPTTLLHKLIAMELLLLIPCWNWWVKVYLFPASSWKISQCQSSGGTAEPAKLRPHQLTVASTHESQWARYVPMMGKLEFSIPFVCIHRNKALDLGWGWWARHWDVGRQDKVQKHWACRLRTIIFCWLTGLFSPLHRNVSEPQTTQGEFPLEDVLRHASGGLSYRALGLALQTQDGSLFSKPWYWAPVLVNKNTWNNVVTPLTVGTVTLVIVFLFLSKALICVGRGTDHVFGFD